MGAMTAKARPKRSAHRAKAHKRGSQPLLPHTGKRAKAALRHAAQVIPWPDTSPGALIAELTALREALLAGERKYRARLKRIDPAHDPSVGNLLHYLLLRRHDLRPLQEALTRMGLSSLGRSEPYVMASLEAVLGHLHRLAGTPALTPDPQALGFLEARAVQLAQEQAVLGPCLSGRQVRIMVTLPSEAAGDPGLVRRLVARGTDLFRINCAHDDEEHWRRMVQHVRQAASESGRPLRILIDLAGPKLRTGPVRSEPPVLRFGPRRDDLGRVRTPARVWIPPEAGRLAPGPVDAVLPVQAPWLAELKPGAVLRLLDARGRSRRLLITGAQHGGWLAECAKTVYVEPGTPLWREQDGGPQTASHGKVGPLAPREGVLRLRAGDPLVLTRSLEPGQPAVYGPGAECQVPARIGCTLPEVFESVRPGQRILFDDGAIEGLVRAVHQHELHVEITRGRRGGAPLRGDKGINLPDTRLSLGALTDKDRRDLAFIAKHADLVGLSFVGSGRDVFALQSELARLKARRLGIVLKIETRRAVENLPGLLLAAMRSPAAGVMIARGDLAVECGYERLAELQEEILWLCEAAHLPVIWATQVLETLAKEGQPSRAEITDAAMGERAECVMLNKGPYIVEAVQTLDDILRRMQEHQHKKRAMLRKLRLARGPRGL
jgi:pyruvate kinase